MTAERGEGSRVAALVRGTPRSRASLALSAALLIAGLTTAPALPAPAGQSRPEPLWHAFPIDPQVSRPLPAPSAQPRRAASPRAAGGHEQRPLVFFLLVVAFTGAIGLVLVGGRQFAAAAGRSVRGVAEGWTDFLSATGPATAGRLRSAASALELSHRVADARERLSGRAAGAAELVTSRWSAVALWVIAAVAAGAAVSVLISLSTQ